MAASYLLLEHGYSEFSDLIGQRAVSIFHRYLVEVSILVPWTNHVTRAVPVSAVH